jgi:hypothetical protein
MYKFFGWLSILQKIDRIPLSTLRVHARTQTKLIESLMSSFMNICTLISEMKISEAEEYSLSNIFFPPPPPHYVQRIQEQI